MPRVIIVTPRRLLLSLCLSLSFSWISLGLGLGTPSLAWAHPLNRPQAKPADLASHLLPTAEEAEDSSQAKLQAALALLATEALAKPSIEALRHSRARLSFETLSRFGPQYQDFDALAWMNANGEVHLFINRKHRKAPVAALAALIAHEALHDDRHNSLNEEVAACQQEARVWQALKPLASKAEVEGGFFFWQEPSPLVQRLEALLAAQQQGQLVLLVRRNPGYAHLPESSPGFEPLLQASRGSSRGPAGSKALQPIKRSSF